MYIINLDLTLVKFICSVHYDGCGSLISFFFFISMFLSRDSLELFALPVTGCHAAC